MSSYEEWKRIYEENPLSSMPWELGKPREQLIEAVESGKVGMGKALDICCGAGTNAVYLAQRGFEAAGIDISSRAIEYAEENARRAGVKIRFIVGNSVHLPFENGEFDFVFDMGCFHHIRAEDRETYIAGINTVLKKDGAYLMICFSQRNGSAWNHFTRAQIATYFRRHFEIEEIKHSASIEGDGVMRYFYSGFMRKI